MSNLDHFWKCFQMLKFSKYSQGVYILLIFLNYANKMSQFSEKFIIFKMTHMEKFHESLKNIYPCLIVRGLYMYFINYCPQKAGLNVCGP